jgi:glycosyltransferase
MILSLVTITFHNAAGLAATLESLRDQALDDVDWEVWVIAGDSDRETADVLEMYSDIPLKYVLEPDEGPYDAMNKGTSLATGEYIQYLNAGDTLRSCTALASVMRGLESKPLWLISGAYHVALKRVIGNLPHRWYAHALGLQSHCHQACWFRRDLVLALGGYTQSAGFAADYDLILRFGLLAQPQVLEDILVSYEGGGISARGGRQIPVILGQVREQRLQLAAFSARLNRAYSLVMTGRLFVLALRKSLQERTCNLLRCLRPRREK